MRNYFALTRVLLKTSTADMAANMGTAKKNKKKSPVGMVLLWVFLGICMLPYLGMMFSGVMSATAMMSLAGQEGMILDLILMIGSMVTLMFGITYVLSIFYMTNDMENLLPLPLSPWQILGAKLTVVYVYECLANLILIGPAFLGFAVGARWGVLNWIIGILQFFLMPIVPLVYAAVLSILLMRIFRRVANRNFVSILSTVLILVIVMVASSFGGSIGAMETMDQEQLMAMMAQGSNSLTGLLGSIFPLLSFASKSAVFGNLLYLLLTLLGNAAFIVLFLFIGQKLYFSGVIGMSEISSKRKKISAGEKKKIVRGNSALGACISKEWKLLFRSPTYFLNCALMPLIWPVFFLFPIVISLVTSGVDLGQLLEEMGNISWEAVGMTLQEPFVVKLVLLILFGLTVFVSSLGFVSGTALSREGQGYIFMKYIPVPYKTQLLAKLSVGMIISLLSTSGYAFLVLLVMVVLGFPALAALFALVISFFANAIVNLIGLWLDLLFPKLNWENEQQAVKQNFNPVIEMLLCMVICGGICALYGVAMLALNLNAYLISLAVVVVLGAVSAGLYVLIMNYGEKKIAGLE